MPIIREQDRKHLQEKFAGELKDEVRLIVFTQDFECEHCKQNRELMEELASLSEKVKIEVYDFTKDADKAKDYGVDKIPATAIIGAKDYGIRYFGIPS